MLAVTIVGPRRLELREIGRPTVRAAGDAVVMVSTAALGPIDIERFRTGAAGLVPGGEFCGTVVEIGASVDSVDVDDLVFATTVPGERGPLVFGRDIAGGHAEYVLVPRADDSLVKTNPASEERALLAGGSLGLGAAAAEAALAALPPGGTLAVVGCDPCGLGALAWLRQKNPSHLVAVEAHRARSVLAKRYGATPVSPGESNGIADVVLAGEIADGPGVDVVSRAAKPGGKIVFCRPGESGEWAARLEQVDVTPLESPWPTREFVSKVAAAVHMRRLDLQAAVSHVVPLDDAEQAYEAAADLVPGVQKVLLKP